MKKYIIISMLAAAALMTSAAGAVHAENIDAPSGNAEIREAVREQADDNKKPSEKTEEAVREQADDSEKPSEKTEEAVKEQADGSEKPSEKTEEAVKEQAGDNKTQADAEIPKTEKPSDVKNEKDESNREKLEDKEAKAEAMQRMREMKQLAKEAKIETLTYLKEMRKMFGEIDKEDRRELLEEIAAAKAEVKDFTIDTFVKGSHIGFEKYDNVLPVIENGHTLIPVRAIAESLGAEVDWNGETREITITKDDTVITMTIGSREAYVNGDEKELAAPPEIKNSRTLVPARFIAESFGLTVDWDGNSQSVIIE